jgi:heavy metal sensor kinase
MRHMPLRYKMTLLYSGLTALLFAVFLAALYFTVQQALLRGQEDLLRLSCSQLVALAEVEDGQFMIDDELKLPPNAIYRITDEQGALLLDHRMPAALVEEPFSPRRIRETTISEQRWLFLDDVQSQDGLSLRIRMGLSLDSISNTLGIIRTVALVSMPALLIIAGLGGLMVARRSLKPIDRIIAATKVVAQGDLSERVQGAQARDEVGELTRMLNDMLDQVQASFLRERRFASDASHELRTPVSIVLAYAESLLHELPAESEGVASVQVILAESERMRRIIAQLLTITRGEEGKYAMEHALVDMGEVIRIVAEQLETLAQECGIALRVAADQDVFVEGDQSLLTQMALNLVENAIRYGKPHGTVDIRVEAAAGKCRVTVSDDGVGIPADNLPHIFERFYRVDSARDRSGSGLGLSITQWIVRMHCGEIAVHSLPGEGTTFVVTL